MELRDQEGGAAPLLRQRSGGAGWNEIAAEVAAAGSAVALLNEPSEDALFASPDLEPELKRAQADVRPWAEASIGS